MKQNNNKRELLPPQAKQKRNRHAASVFDGFLPTLTPEFSSDVKSVIALLYLQCTVALAIVQQKPWPRDIW